jgi:hypothetical protein
MPPLEEIDLDDDDSEKCCLFFLFFSSIHFTHICTGSSLAHITKKISSFFTINLNDFLCFVYNVTVCCHRTRGYARDTVLCWMRASSASSTARRVQIQVQVVQVDGRAPSAIT